MRLRNMDEYAYIQTKVEIECVITGVERREAESGKIFFVLTAMDKGKKIEITSYKDLDLNELILGSVYQCIIKVVKSNDRINFRLESIVESQTDNAEDYINFIPDYLKVVEDYDKAIESLEGTVYYKVIKPIYEKFRSNFIMVPAGVSMHHTEFGGAMFHSLSVARICAKLADGYNQLYGSSFINKTLLVTAALVHDLAKAEELTINMETFETSYSKSSFDDTHITRMISEIDYYARLYKLTTRKEIRYLRHCILSHHGCPEFGSPKYPMLIEAILLNIADGMDAKVWAVANNLKNMDLGEIRRVKILDKYQDIMKR